MNDQLFERQKRALMAHIKDYQSASQLSKKGQAIIFEKHRLPSGEYAPELKEELKDARVAFAKEWGTHGWRNEHFIKNMIEDAQRPDETEVNDMHQQYQDVAKDIEDNQQEVRTKSAQDFRSHLSEQGRKQKDSYKPKMR